MSQAVEEALASRWGLVARPTWRAELPRALERVRERHGLAPDPGAETFLERPSLLQEVAELLLVGESFFFRHRAQLEEASVAVARRARSGELTRVLSVGCSRGEEAYSLVALLDGMLTSEEIARVSVVGNDLHAPSIEQARRAEFQAWSLRSMSEVLRAQYFEQNGGTYRLHERLRGRVHFEHRSIQDQLGQTATRSVDLVLFRNVAIYLTEDALRETLTSVERVLRPGGHLVMAPTDPLLTVAGQPGLRRTAMPVGVFERARNSAPPPATGKRARAPRSRRRHSRPAATLDDENTRLLESALENTLENALALADGGKLQQARSQLEGILSEYPEHREARAARAQIYLAEQRFEAALRDFELLAADPADLVARYYKTLCLSALGRVESSVRELAQLEALLSSRTFQPANDLPTRRELLDVVRSDLRRMT